MILVLVLVGLVVGTSAAVTALAGGGGLLAALVAYGLFSFGAVVLTALIVAVAPAWPKARTGAKAAMARPPAAVGPLVNLP
jgi:L-cystine uptake protein TcyP (sodium:dicarboxylate symporter family)